MTREERRRQRRDERETAEQLAALTPVVVVLDNERVIDQIARAAGEALYFADSADYRSALWSVLRLSRPDLAALLDADPSAAGAVLFPEDR